MRRLPLLLCVLMIVAGAAGFLYLRGRSDPPIPSTGGAVDLDGTISGIPHWRQVDPAWGAETLGGSGETMAGAGCTITSVAMALQTMGIVMTPPEVCRGLKAHGGFTPQGQLIWKTLGELTCDKVRAAFPSLTHAAIDHALRQRIPVITKIMLAGDIPHWILIVGKRGPEYLAIDPLDPTATTIPVSTLSTHLHAIRILERN